MWAMEAMELTTGGPDTHDDPHETGAARKAVQGIFVQKNHFRKYQKCLNLWFE